MRQKEKNETWINTNHNVPIWKQLSGIELQETIARNVSSLMLNYPTAGKRCEVLYNQEARKTKLLLYHLKIASDRCSIEVPQNLPTHILPDCLFMIQNSIGCCNHNVAPLMCRKLIESILLDILGLNVLPIHESPAILDPALEFHSYPSYSVRIMYLEVFDISSIFHDTEESSHDIGNGFDLSSGKPSLLCIHDRAQRVVQYPPSHFLLPLPLTFFSSPTLISEL